MTKGPTIFTFLSISVKGYLVGPLTEVFTSYISPPSEENTISRRYSATTRAQSGENPLFQSATEGACSGSKNARNHALGAECSGVAAQKPEMGAERKNEPCFTCRGGQFWLSVYGAKVCARCHPPAEDRLVKEWIVLPFSSQRNTRFCPV